MDGKTEILMSQPLTPDETRAKTKISEDFYSIFTNQVRIAASPYEFRLFIGENYPTASGEVRIVENISIIMTPVYAKQLAANLLAVVEKREALSGPIPALQETPPTGIALPITPDTGPQE